MTIKPPEPPFKLTPGDRESETWKRLSKHIEARLAKARATNDTDLPEQETAKLRGRIFELKALLDLAKDNPIPPPG